MTARNIGGTGCNVIPTKRDRTRAITWAVVYAIALGVGWYLGSIVWGWFR